MMITDDLAVVETCALLLLLLDGRGYGGPNAVEIPEQQRQVSSRSRSAAEDDYGGPYRAEILAQQRMLLFDGRVTRRTQCDETWR
ncbi:hypothetical protein TNCT_247101 [Trichonephila clavata]|uniref:Secreted protein n=1 Tax=Trichonephila clavata TaxID=2740835 RepID=A0A8X6L7A6_TRICU|nr:hypothetical protein TNCT_247101 [Trichonephila clavata]